jgi:hypothetical protein
MNRLSPPSLHRIPLLSIACLALVAGCGGSSASPPPGSADGKVTVTDGGAPDAPPQVVAPSPSSPAPPSMNLLPPVSAATFCADYAVHNARCNV